VRRSQPLALQRALLFLCAIVAAAACMGLLFMKSQVLETQRDINKLQKGITDLQRANSEVSAQVTAAQNIGDIMDRAQKMGMKAPNQSQVLYVSLGDNTIRADMSAKTVGQDNTAQ
jgi:cell division protein FtsL